MHGKVLLGMVVAVAAIFSLPAFAVAQGRGTNYGGDSYCSHCKRANISGPSGHNADCRYFRGPEGGTPKGTVPGAPQTWRQLGNQVAREAIQTGVQSLLSSLLSSRSGSRSDGGNLEIERRHEREAEQKRQEAIRLEQERLARIRVAAEMRSEWERRDAEMSQRLAGAFDVIPIRPSTPFFGIPGNPDEELVPEALGEDASAAPWQDLFDGSPGGALVQFEASLREGPPGEATLGADYDLRDAYLAPRPRREAGGASVVTALLTGSRNVRPTPIQPTPIGQFKGPKGPVFADPLPFGVVRKPRPRVEFAQVGKQRECRCGGQLCGCTTPICGGTRGCSCSSQSADCTCRPRQGICRFAGTNVCCGGSHEDSTNRQQRCNTTCLCGHEAGGVGGCSVGCNRCPNRPVTPDSRK